MNVFILVGTWKKNQEYLEKFKKENGIPSYFETVYEDFKIVDARVLQKLVSQKLPKDKKRLFVISNPTHEAQNAILKAIEELPPYAFVFFISNNRESFLPTIISRSRIIDLGFNVSEDKILEEKIEQTLASSSDASLFSIVEKLDTEEEIEKFIISLRGLTRDFIKKEKDYSSLFIFLKKLTDNFALIKSNNINKKLSIENSILALDRRV